MKYLSVLIALMAASGLMAQSALHWPITDVTTPDSCTVNAHSPLIIMPAQDTVNVCPDPSWTSIPGMSSLSPLSFHPATFHYGTTANGASYMNLGHSGWFTVGAVFQISGTGTFTVDSVQIKHYGINNPAISSYRVDLADSQWVWDIVDGIPPTDDVHDLTSAGLYVNGDFSFRIWAIMPTGTWASADTALAQPFQGDYWSIDEVNICITPTSEKHLGIKAILEGPVVIANTLMRDDLRTIGLIPLNEPYTQLGYSFAGGGGESIASSVLNVSGPDAIVDWVVVELRDTSNFSLIYSRSALIQRDGDVVDLDGVSLVGVSVPQGAFQVVLRHRNHLPIRTVCPVALTDTAYIDWTDPATETCQPDALKNISGVPLLWVGNVLMDDEVKYIGSANDRDPILIRIGGSVPTNTVQGYFEEDVNMDGTVKYIGASNDRDPILLNIGGSVPTNVLGGPLDAGCGACTVSPP